jgi:hypothetical protein
MRTCLDDGVVEPEADIVWLGDRSDEDRGVFGIAYWFAGRVSVSCLFNWGEIEVFYLFVNESWVAQEMENILWLPSWLIDARKWNFDSTQLNFELEEHEWRESTYLRTKASRLIGRQTFSNGVSKEVISPQLLRSEILKLGRWKRLEGEQQLRSRP